jgi:hypothetical protein
MAYIRGLWLDRGTNDLLGSSEAILLGSSEAILLGSSEVVLPDKLKV